MEDAIMYSPIFDSNTRVAGSIGYHNYHSSFKVTNLLCRFFKNLLSSSCLIISDLMYQQESYHPNSRSVYLSYLKPLLNNFGSSLTVIRMVPSNSASHRH